MKIPLAIIGAGGQAREIAGILADLEGLGQSPWQLIGFLADAGASAVNARGLPAPLLGAPEWLADHPETQVVIGIGESRGRQAMACRLREIQPAVVFATVVHPRAWLASSASVGAGSVVMAGALVNVGVQIGEHAILNLGCTISHDCVLGCAVSVGPGAHLAGAVQIGDQVELGVGVALRPRARVGARTVVGAGAVVVADLPENCVAYGIPALPAIVRND